MKFLITFVFMTVVFLVMVATSMLAIQPIQAVSLELTGEKICEFVVEYKLTQEFPFTKEIVRDCKVGDEAIATILYDRRNKVAHLITKE